MGKDEGVNSEELQYGVKRIYQWYKKSIKTLSILTSPFNSVLIFSDIILEVVKQEKQVLYVWGKYGENNELVNELRKRKSNISYANISSGISKSDVIFVNYKDIDMIDGKYELVIIDEISSFSALNLDRVREIYDIAVSLANRIIMYGVEEITPIGEKIVLAPIIINIPFVEPRLITTRIDLNKDIPYILYDYIRWFKEQKKTVIIFVPDEERISLIFDYYTKVLKMNEVKIMALYKDDCKKIIKSGLKIKEKATFIITNYMEGNLDRLRISDAIVLFADDLRYNYKKLIFVCGEMGKMNNSLPEVLFVSRDISEDMDRVKSMSREYNKMIWEKR